MVSYLRPVDRSDLLVSQVYGIADKMGKRAEELPTASAIIFLESLRFDENGNLMGTLYIQGNKHDILLCHHSKPARNQGAAEETAEN